MKTVMIIIIKSYQKLISPLKLGKCRFYPTCSQYAIDSIEKYGVIKGGYRSIKRLAKCHPFNPGGYDPVN